MNRPLYSRAEKDYILVTLVRPEYPVETTLALESDSGCMNSAKLLSHCFLSHKSSVAVPKSIAYLNNSKR